MTRTRRLYRVIITNAYGHTSTRHYQTRKAAEYRRAQALDGYTRDRDTPEPYRVEPAQRVVVEASDPITWPDGDTPGGAS